jgi:hypothetical protein
MIRLEHRFTMSDLEELKTAFQVDFTVTYISLTDNLLMNFLG